MLISAVVAASDNDVIGSKGQIPWHIKGEQKRAKEITMGKPLLMGRATHESIGRTLPGRLNVVISSNPNFKVYEGSVLAGSLDEALALDEVKNADEVIIFGGETIYSESLPMLDRIYLTRVHAEFSGDRFFKIDPKDWKVVSKEEHQKGDNSQYDYDYLTLERVKE